MKIPPTLEWSFAVLRALAMLGGMIALFLVPHPPEHKSQLVATAWGFVSYKILLFLVIWRWSGHLRRILLGTAVLDLGFVALFVWLGGGLQSHFSLLFYLLIALVAAHFGPGMGMGAAAGSGLFYALASLPELSGLGWHLLAGRAATFFLLGGSLGYLSQRERQARTEAEQLNEDLRENQDRLRSAYRALQSAQDRLVQAERLAVIGQMSAKISHEVRNPLSSISLNTELLEDELQALPPNRRGEAAALLKAIRSQVDLLGTATEEYLRFARLPKPKPERVALASVVRGLAEFVRGELEARRVRLELEVEDGLPDLLLDPGQIRQALLNLVRNATDAMPGGGTVRIEARTIAADEAGAGVRGGRGENALAPRPPGPPAPQRLVEVTVADTGPGIPEEHREKIFEPFFTTKDGGTGLGLAIVRQITEDHGGIVICERQAGGGTMFRLSLPCAE
ncbi:MAG: hypothetical protein HY712_05630 [candidate division NC10 bacterium]|nr:hypothetical protein [candidate division NC10 bacterium]